MRTLLLAFLLMAACAAAQEFPVKGPATKDPTKNSSQLRTYQGCVSRSQNGIALETISKQQFRLTGSVSLDSYVGKEVRIDAHNVNPNDPSSSERSMSSTEPQNVPVSLVVEHIQKVSDTCKPQK